MPSDVSLTLDAVIFASADVSPPRDMVITTHHWHFTSCQYSPLLHHGGLAQSCPVWGWTTTSPVTQPCVHPGCSTVGEFHHFLTQTQSQYEKVYIVVAETSVRLQ